MKKIIFLGILVFVISISFGYLYSSLFLDNTNENLEAKAFENNEIEDFSVKASETLTVSSETEKVSPNANFAIKQYYDECNHFDFKYSKLPQKIVNLTRQEVEDYYNDYEVEEFDNNNVVLSKEINGYCNEHFCIKLIDDKIEIMQLDTDGSFIPFQKTEIGKEYLTEEDIKKLEEGIFVFGSGNINSILEDYE